jgi:hypothetical protein
MPKHVLETLDLAKLNLALDHAVESGLAAIRPDPEEDSACCVYLAYVGDAQLAAFAARLPHIEVQFTMPGNWLPNKVVRKVFSKPAVWHVLRLAFADESEFAPCVRDLESVHRKYWRVLPAAKERAKSGGRRRKKPKRPS